MMERLAQCLRDFLEDYFHDALLRTPDSALRPILVGPPREALGQLFELMTSDCQGDWALRVSGRDYSTAILWIDDATSEQQTPLRSQRCNWDYAVTVRNSARHAVCLVSPSGLDTMPESIANTTDLIRAADCGRGRWRTDRIWSHVATCIARNLGTTEHIVRALFDKTVLRGREELEPRLLRRWAWIVADRLLQPVSAPTTSVAAMAAACGLTSCQGAAMTDELLSESVGLIHRLGAFLEEHGLSDGIEMLKATDAAHEQGIEDALDGLARHVFGKAGSGLAFSRAPTWYFRPDSPTCQWWLDLDAEALSAILQQAGAGDGPGLPRLSVTCANRLDGRTSHRSEPAIVCRRVELRVTGPDGEVPTLTGLDRIVGRSRHSLPIDRQESETYCDDCNDESLQSSGKPFRYECRADDFRPGDIKVIVLDWFACQGVARVREAQANGYPKRPQRQTEGDWRQEVRVSRTGVHDLEVYHATRAATVELCSDLGVVQSRPATNPARFIVEGVEHNAEFGVVLRDEDGQPLASWIVAFSVDEQDARKAPTRFDALVLAHQERTALGPVQPHDSPLRSIEESYLACEESWRPVLACWDTTPSTPLNIEWADPYLGTIRPQSDPRPPSIAVPPELIRARTAIQSVLRRQARPLVEIDLAGLQADLGPQIVSYLDAYMRWIQEAPHQAMWFDCIALHAPEDNPQAGCTTASTEPLAIALSPLHPLRIGWQYLAQLQLTESLHRPCPAAGLLDPYGCPSVGAWPLASGGGDDTSRAFFAITTEDPYWGVLINKHHLTPMARGGGPSILGQLGLGYRGLVGRFTKSQTMGALEEVSKILSTRSVLRVGIVGSGQATSECVEGIVDWCDQYLGDGDLDEPASARPGPQAVEIVDETPSPAGARRRLALSSERIASLSERSSGRVKWFARTAQGTRPEDLVIVDQLGVHNPQGVMGESRSPIGHGALYRSRVREDAQNGWWLTEARIAKDRSSSRGVAGLLERLTCVFEGTAVRDHGTSQLRFHPNQEAIGGRLAQARFLAVTSSHVDPACLTRSVEAQNGLVWDYEVPGALGTEEKTAGYYLITRSSQAMEAAVSRAAQLVADEPPPPNALLREISRRGIPLLKRMTSGGSASRGELGMLLAVRLLQDAFREGATLAPRLPVYAGDCIHMIIPVDPLDTPIARMAQALRQRSTRHPDLLVFAIGNPTGRGEAPVSVKVTPLEVKFRASRMSLGDLADGLSQAAALGQLLADLWTAASEDQLWTTCAAAFLAQMLEYGFRIYADDHVHHVTSQAWRAMQEAVLQAVLCGDANVRVVSAGRLVVFDDSDPTVAVDMDGDGCRDTAIICRADAAALLLGEEPPSTSADEAIALLDFTCDAYLQAERNAPHGADAGRGAGGGGAEGWPRLAAEPTPLAGDARECSFPDTATVPSGREGDDASRGEESSGEQVTIAVELRRQIDRAFADFIGNERAVATLKRSLVRALTQTPPHLDKNFLLVGQPSTGKTELAKRMAAALGLPFVRVDGPVTRTREKLFGLIDATLAEAGQTAQEVGSMSGLPMLEYPPVVVFVDEIHLMPRRTQEALLTLLERSDRTVTLEGTRPRVAWVPSATFLFATTRASELDKPFRSRCLEVILEGYTRAEVAEIVGLVEPDWPTEILLQIATYARLVPRMALALAQELKDEMLASREPSRSIAEHLERVARSMGIVDERGLREVDIEYLEALEQGGRPLGETAILNMLGSVDREAILGEVEPYLIRGLGFVALTRQGREITSKGRDFILERRRRGLNL